MRRTEDCRNCKNSVSYSGPLGTYPERCFNCPKS